MLHKCLLLFFHCLFGRWATLGLRISGFRYAQVECFFSVTYRFILLQVLYCLLFFFLLVTTASIITIAIISPDIITLLLLLLIIVLFNNNTSRLSHCRETPVVEISFLVWLEGLWQSIHWKPCINYKKCRNRRHNSYLACVGRQLKETWQKSILRESICWSLFTVRVIIFICESLCQEKSLIDSCIGKAESLWIISTSLKQDKFGFIFVKQGT